MPFDLPIDTALYLHASGSGEAVFSVMIVQEVLRDQRELQSAPDLPTDAAVELEVGRHFADYGTAIDGQRVGPAQRRVELQIRRQVQGGAQRELMPWVGGLVQRVVQVELARSHVQALAQIVVAGVHGPEIEWPAAGADFDTVRMPLEIVGKEERQDGLRSEARTAHNPVAVVESRHGSRDGRGEETLVTDLIGRDILGTEGAASLQHRELWRSGLDEVTVDPRGRARGSRDRRPKRLAVGKAEIEACVGLDLESRIVVVLDLRPQYHTQSGQSHDLILSESAEETLIQCRWEETERGRIFDHIVRIAIADTPDDLVDACKGNPMLEVDVVSREIVVQQPRRRQRQPVQHECTDRIEQMRAVVVALEAKVRIMREHV